MTLAAPSTAGTRPTRAPARLAPPPMSRSAWYRARARQTLEQVLFGAAPHVTCLRDNWLHRRVLVRHIREEARALGGTVADLGAGRRPYRPFITPHVDLYTALDLPDGLGHAGGTDEACVAGDLEHLPYGDGTLDGLLCTQVLTHVADPHRVVGEMHRVLRDGGRAIVTTSFAAPIQCEPWDRWRYAPDGLAAMLRRHGFTVERTRPIGGFFAAGAICFNTCLLLGNQTAAPDRRRFARRQWACVPLVLTANLLGALFDRLFPLDRMPIGMVIVARKAAES